MGVVDGVSCIDTKKSTDYKFASFIFNLAIFSKLVFIVTSKWYITIILQFDIYLSI